MKPVSLIVLAMFAFANGMVGRDRLLRELQRESPTKQKLWLEKGNLKIWLNKSATLAAFQIVWAQVRSALISGDRNSGVGMFPNSKMEFSEEMKMIRYENNFVPAVQSIIFFPGHPFDTGVNFFSLLSKQEKEHYLGANMTGALQSTIKQYDPVGLKHYNKEQRSGRIPAEIASKDSFFHANMDPGVYSSSEESVNYTATVTARNTGSYPTAGIFAALGVFESQINALSMKKEQKKLARQVITFSVLQHQHNKFTPLSRQWLVNCLKEGGWLPNRIYKYLQRTKYIPTEDNVPYIGTREYHREECLQQSTPNGLENFQGTRQEKVFLSTETGMIDNFKKYGPVVVCIFVDDMVFFYSDGMFNQCREGLQCNHFVTLVGYNKLYMTFLNNWGSDWGVEGRMNILRGTCDLVPGGGRFAVFALQLKAQSDSPADYEQTKAAETLTDSKPMLMAAESFVPPPKESYYSLMIRHPLINKKDYYFTEHLQVNDVLVLKADSVTAPDRTHAYVNLLEGGLSTDIPYYIMIDLLHHTVYQTYYLVDHHTEFQKIVEKLNSDNIHGAETIVIRIRFTRSRIESSVNGQELEHFYHQVAIENIAAFEVVGPAGFFKSAEHTRPQ